MEGTTKSIKRQAINLEELFENKCNLSHKQANEERSCNHIN